METSFDKIEASDDTQNHSEKPKEGRVFNLTRKTEDAINIITTEMGSLLTNLPLTKQSYLRQRSAHLKTNPYLSSGFKESQLLAATNQYHKLDKTGNMYLNKAFA